ncbi:CoA transferase [Kitasatospora aureofaciens]|uniref:CoA transferase n=1 Tax=Kitasatospora aureofaciens TaxID=1894 RepID=UPI001C478860|nr:CoA transferase [Kitasatospora aureofaciens]MBV6697277.1 CoA transferase [Kitasatospora aureofaciens]
MTERPTPQAEQSPTAQSVTEQSPAEQTPVPQPVAAQPVAERPPVDGPTAHAWAALGGSADLLERVSFHGPDAVLPSGLPVRQLARATVAACSLAAAELAAHRNGGPVPAVRVDQGAVATAFVSERHLTVDGRTPVTFAPHSGFWRTADGWVRTHANYPHHRTRLLTALDLPADAGPEHLAKVLGEQPSERIQERAYEAGALAVAVAPVSATAHPLVETRIVDSGPSTARQLGPAALPADGIRVLDLTRVIAGPVATRTLALLGADVLRVDSPHLPEADDAHADTGFGKRSTRLDLADPADRAVFEDLLATADVVITGYRPGALDAHGLAPDALPARRPDLIVAQLCAWGWTGPWAGRRGFDSLVQAGVGIAGHESAPDGHPGVLPAQALDHGTGYLIAAAVLRALTDQRTGRPGGRHLRFSLAGTASWLLHGIEPEASASDEPYDSERWLAETDSAYGRLRHALPPIAYDGAPTDWSRPPGRWGSDPATWL